MSVMDRWTYLLTIGLSPDLTFLLQRKSSTGKNRHKENSLLDWRQQCYHFTYYLPFSAMLLLPPLHPTYRGPRLEDRHILQKRKIDLRLLVLSLSSPPAGCISDVSVPISSTKDIQAYTRTRLQLVGYQRAPHLATHLPHWYTYLLNLFHILGVLFP